MEPAGGPDFSWKQRPDWAFHAALVAGGVDPEQTPFATVLDALSTYFDDSWKKCLDLSPDMRQGAWVGTFGELSVGRERGDETALFHLDTVTSVTLDVRLVITDDLTDPRNPQPDVNWVGKELWRPTEVRRPFAAHLSLPYLTALRGGTGTLIGPDVHWGMFV